MNEALYLQLKDKYLTDQLTEPEFHTFWDQLSRQENQSWLDKFITEIWGNPVLHQLSNAARKEIILERILARQTLLRRLVSNHWTKIAAAAVVVGIAAGIWMTKDQPVENTTPFVVTKDLDPGKTGATLVLADHSEIKLDSNSAGPVTKQKGASIKAVKGQLQYVPDPGIFELSYNEMHTARGNTFCVQLPDGSKAWLNAASSIRYPTSFPTSTRSVSITGEVHFEVKQDAQRPFFVEANKQAVIEVLGTDFNVKAYDNDSSVTTSLLSGSIRIRKIKDSSGAVELKPGQATLLVKDQLKVTEADITQVLAWKKGNFYFYGATVQEFMRDLERWYDFETIYPEGIPDIRLSGSMSRTLKLSQILEVIENLGLQSSIENRKVTITIKHH